jgi:uroporphyrinogen-III synthase
MRVVVTRPEREAHVWAQALADAGHDPLVLPLLAFDLPSNPDLLHAQQTRQNGFSAIMFVSSQAVDAWCDDNFKENWHLALDGKDFVAPNFLGPIEAVGVRFWAPGPATARALLGHGVPQDRIDQPSLDAGQFDSEALWSVVNPQAKPGKHLLVVRGESALSPSGAADSEPSATGHGRDWLARQCEARGMQVEYAVAYRRVMPCWTPQQWAQAQAACDPSVVWLFSSSQAVGQLSRMLPDKDWQVARALATHPRIAQQAMALGFGDARVCRPTLPDVLAALNDGAVLGPPAA